LTLTSAFYETVVKGTRLIPYY